MCIKFLKGKIPKGSINISENGKYDVTDYAEANVYVSSGGEYNAKMMLSSNSKKGSLNSFIEEIPLIDTSNITSMSSMFNGCSNLKTIPLLNTTNVTSMQSMFANCLNLKTIPLLNTANVTDMYGLFMYCLNLESIPLLNTNNVLNMGSMFDGCSNLKTIPLLNTTNVTSMGSMFRGCSNLETIPQLNTTNVTNMQRMFNGCPNLSNDSLNNILTMCINTSSKYTRNKTLAEIGLSSSQATICKSLGNYQDFLDAGWTTGY